MVDEAYLRSYIETHLENLPADPVFVLPEESALNILDHKCLDGESIDASLIRMTGLLVMYSFSPVVLPNYFLTCCADSGPNSTMSWLPESMIKYVDIYIMAAHHTNHWCLAAVDVNHNYIYYLDPLKGAADPEISKHHVSTLKALFFTDKLMKCKTEPKVITVENAAPHFGINLPQQPNLIDCGLFKVLYCVMILSRKLSHKLGLDSWFTGRLTIMEHSIPSYRRVLLYLVIQFMDHRYVRMVVESSYTSKWFSGLALFPMRKKKTRKSLLLSKKKHYERR